MKKYGFSLFFAIVSSLFINIALDLQRQTFVSEGCELMNIKQQGNCSIAFGKLSSKYYKQTLLVTFLSTFVVGQVIDASMTK